MENGNVRVELPYYKDNSFEKQILKDALGLIYRITDTNQYKNWFEFTVGRDTYIVFSLYCDPDSFGIEDARKVDSGTFPIKMDCDILYETIVRWLDEKKQSHYYMRKINISLYASGGMVGDIYVKIEDGGSVE